MSRPARSTARHPRDTDTLGQDAARGTSAALASAIAASAKPASTGYDGDREYRLLTLRDRWLTARADLNRLLDRQRAAEEEGEEVKPDLDAAITAAHEEENVLLSVMAIEPARTLRGLAIKVEASASRQHGEHKLVASIMRDVLTLGAIVNGT